MINFAPGYVPELETDVLSAEIAVAQESPVSYQAPDTPTPTREQVLAAHAKLRDASREELHAASDSGDLALQAVAEAIMMSREVMRDMEVRQALMRAGIPLQ